jgi:crotonobetainyl-CoA:carnitine CoA-transferase CaiB-like acyl-CoA transferase
MPGWDGLVGSAVGIYPAPLFGKGDPWFTAMPLASNFAAFMAAHRIAGALLSRLKTGRGQWIEMALYDAAFQALGFAPEMPTSKPTTMSRGPQFEHLCRMRRASDGTWLFFDAPLRGLQRLIDHYLPGYDLLRLNLETAEKLGRELDDLIATRPGAEWERIGQEKFLGAFGLAQPVDHWLRDRHALDSQTLIEVDDPELGATIQPGFPVTMSRSRPGLRWPRGGADAESGETIDWLGPRPDEPVLADDGTGLPLHGLRVVDCASLLAGPTTARVLAQYGAEIIKIDKPSLASGETDPLSDDNAAFFGARSCSSGKRMVYLDLQHPEGREVMQALVREADVLHHNFTADAARRLGLAPEQLAEINPSLIVSTISLHARGGYRETYRGHDPVAQLVTGMGHRMGGDDNPSLFTIYLNDNIAGHVHALGVMLALLHRDRTGEGQMVNCSLSQVATMHQVPFMIGHAGRTSDEPTGLSARGWHALHRLYRARDGWFFVADESPRARAALDACCTASRPWRTPTWRHGWKARSRSARRRNASVRCKVRGLPPIVSLPCRRSSAIRSPTRGG